MTVPGVAGAPDDAHAYAWTGSGYALTVDALVDMGLDASADLDGLTMVAPDHFYASFTTNTTVVPDGVGTVEDQDIVEYNAGTWSMFYDATGLTTMDAIHVAGPNAIYFSTATDSSVSGVSGPYDDADIYMWNGSGFSRMWDATAALPAGGGIASTSDVDGLTIGRTEPLLRVLPGRHHGARHRNGAR